MAKSTLETKVITNWGGRLTRIQNGDMNSGFADYTNTHGVIPFLQPNTLTFYENPVQIDAAGAVITDLIVTGKARNESGVTYVYAVGHTGRVYKIQANNPGINNPVYNTPVLLTTLTNGQTFKYTSSIQFYQGAGTEQMFIGCDQNVTLLNFDGSGETVIGTTDATHWIANVPRQSVQFIGKMYWTNGSNIAEIDSTLTVTTYTKLSPGFPLNTQSRDVKTTADGRYLVIVVTRGQQTDITLTTVDTSNITNAESYLVYWNGTDLGATSFTTIPSFEQTTYATFGSSEYAFGYDIAGASVSNPTQKILSGIFNESPMPQSTSANGNILGWIVPEFVNGFLNATGYLWGSLDYEVKQGYWRQFRWPAQGTETDVVAVPWSELVTNLSFAKSTGGYSGGVAGTGMTYFSTLETSSGTTKYKLYWFADTPGGTGTAIAGQYRTQVELFSKKQSVKEVRVYMNPTVANVSFTVAIIGIDGKIISGTSSTYTYTAGTDNTLSQGSIDMYTYNPESTRTAAIGLQITNVGSVSPVISKVEIDYEPAGK